MNQIVKENGNITFVCTCHAKTDKHENEAIGSKVNKRSIVTSSSFFCEQTEISNIARSNKIQNKSKNEVEANAYLLYNAMLQ